MKTQIDSEPKKCLNCGLPSDDQFCPSCGQSMAVHQITFKETIRDFLSSTFSLEGPLLNTIKMLVVNPGKMLSEFLSGKRKAYYKPVSFFVLTTVIYILIRSSIGYDPLGNESFPESNDHADNVKLTTQAAQYMVKNISNVMLFLVFALGIWQKILFPKRYNLAEYTSVGFYISGIYTIVGTFLMLVIHYLYPISKQSQLLFLIVYIIYVLYSLHKEHSFISVVKYGFVAILSLLFYMILGFGFSYLVVTTW